MAERTRSDRLFLLYPPLRVHRETAKQVFSPLGVAYLAAAVRDLVDVEVMDAVVEDFDREEELAGGFVQYGATLDEIRRRIERFEPGVVGITCLHSAAFPVIREICRMVKAIDPAIRTVVGGSFPTFLPERCLEDRPLDMVVLGEGEQTLRRIIRRLQHGESLAGVDGLAYRDGDRVVVHPKTEWIEDLDSLPFPARDLLPLERYREIGIPFSFAPRRWNNASLITSRGCSARCTFCCSARFWGNHIRFRSPENVLAEIDELVQRWGVGEIQFEDDNLTLRRDHARAIFSGIIERGYDLKLNFPNGVALWTIDEELVDLMVEAGCYEMTLAIESGCQEVLRKIVRKPLKLDQALRIGHYIKQTGIQTNAFYMIGFPGETREQIQQTFRFADRLGTDTAFFFVANPLPGTRMYEIASDQGLLRSDFQFENQAFTRSAYHAGVFPPGELERLAARQFVKYSLRSLFRSPVRASRMLFGGLLVHRPRYFAYLVRRVLRRVHG